MSILQLVKSGLNHVRRGELHPIVDWISEQLREKEGMQIVDESSTVTNHIQSYNSSNIVQDGDKYYNYLDSVSSADFKISTSNSFDTLEFGIGNTSQVESISIDIQFSSGEQEKKASFENTKYVGDLDYVPFNISQTTEHTSARISVEQYQLVDNDQQQNNIDNDRIIEPFLTLPSVSSSTSTTRPIFLISVDTWRYDRVDLFEDLLGFLGNTATVPKEPRTQGFFTTPSHASMFTGVQPGDHQHVMANQKNNEPIPETLVTLGEFLGNSGFKNSGLVSHTRLLPNFGYGRGFHRYELDHKQTKNWMREDGNARSLVDRTCQWIDKDIEGRVDQPFYFLHLFDPHSPFYPPLPYHDRSRLDFATIEKFFDEFSVTADDEDYLQFIENDLHIDDSILSEVERTYDKAVEYTGNQLLRLVRHLDHQNIFDDALIIITGDHGYEFGERGFVGAKSLYDNNIRQGMIVKPPADSNWTVPDKCDTIDILPTIAHEIGEKPPEQCQGTAWQIKADDPTNPRITERIRKKHYNVAVEHDGLKAIYTYQSNYPHRPTTEQLESGPLKEEYYHPSAVRDGDFADIGNDISIDRRKKLKQIATQFASKNPLAKKSENQIFIQPSQETEEQLRKLGYK
jgi:arylsulfatase A-like enzyme